MDQKEVILDVKHLSGQMTSHNPSTITNMAVPGGEAVLMSQVIHEKDQPSRDVQSQLDDHKHVQPADFKGASLQSGSNVILSGTPEDCFEGAGLSRDRPGSSVSRTSVTSAPGRTSVNAKVVPSKILADKFFCRKEGLFEKAVEELKANLQPGVDGELRGAWLLTEIDHWDNDREKLVMVTDNSLVVIKYDFITLHVVDQKSVFLHMIDTLKTGDFVYPPKSLMWPREHGGAQVLWNKGTQPTLSQCWNPWCTDIPWLTFSHHPLYYQEKERNTAMYDVDDFAETLCQTIQRCYERKNVNGTLSVLEGPIQIQTYASVTSPIFNQSHLGFCMDRSGVSF